MVSRQYVCGCVASYETVSAWFWSKMDKPKSNLQVWLDHSAKWMIFKYKTISNLNLSILYLFSMLQELCFKISIRSIVTQSTFVRMVKNYFYRIISKTESLWNLNQFMLFLLLMSSLNMALKIGFSIRSIVTQSALEGLFSCMNHLMPS